MALATGAFLCSVVSAAAPRAAAERLAAPSTWACAEALTREGGPRRRPIDGGVEEFLPPACGGDYAARTVHGDVCRDRCFVRDGASSLHIAARFREGDMLVTFRREGERWEVGTAVGLAADEVELLAPDAGGRLARTLEAVHGIARGRAVPAAGERLGFYLVAWSWREEQWREDLAAALVGAGGLRLTPIASLRSDAGRDAVIVPLGRRRPAVRGR